LLDQEVLALLTRATPLPSLPPQMRDDQVELNIPIRFRLK
jgi:protein TonB